MSFLDGHQRVEVPVVEVRPTIDSENLDALGITETAGAWRFSIPRWKLGQG